MKMTNANDLILQKNYDFHNAHSHMQKYKVEINGWERSQACMGSLPFQNHQQQKGK